MCLSYLAVQLLGDVELYVWSAICFLQPLVGSAKLFVSDELSVGLAYTSCCRAKDFASGTCSVVRQCW